jgi:Uma2 family endonuclease
MRTVVLDPSTASFDEMLERRRRSGLDRMDEVWDGVLHMVPAPTGRHSQIEWQLAYLLKPLAERVGLRAGGQFNLGDSDDNFRVPDGGLHRTPATGTWHSTAALVIEIVSPSDESWEKLPYYAARGVDEVLIVDPEQHSVHWLGLHEGEYQPIEHSALIDLGPGDLAEQIDWP